MTSGESEELEERVEVEQPVTVIPILNLPVIEPPFLVADELFLTDFQVGDRILMKPLRYTVAKHNKAKL